MHIFLELSLEELYFLSSFLHDTLKGMEKNNEQRHYAFAHILQRRNSAYMANSLIRAFVDCCAIQFVSLS